MKQNSEEGIVALHWLELHGTAIMSFSLRQDYRPPGRDMVMDHLTWLC